LVTTATPPLTVLNSIDAEADTLTYEFEVYSDPGLTTLVASTTGVAAGIGSTSWTVNTALSEDGHFYWRSRAFDGYEHSAFTDSATFFVNAVNQPPQAFSLIDPPNGAVIQDTFPRLTWNGTVDTDPGDEVLFTLWTTTDSTFSVFTQTANLSDTFRTLTYPLTLGQTYYWKVKAVDLSLAATWSSETFTFSTGEPPCCQNRGNVDGIIGVGGPVDVADLTFLVAYLFQSGAAPPCDEEGNVDGIVGVGGPTDVADLTFLVAFLFQSGAPPPAC
jgi:hypothetical protein